MGLVAAAVAMDRGRMGHSTGPRLLHAVDGRATTGRRAFLCASGLARPARSPGPSTDADLVFSEHATMIANRDVAAMAATIVGFAVLVTAHLAIAAGLLGRAPRWRAPIALFFPLFAPYSAVRERMWARASIWIAAALLYAIGLAMARH